MSTANGPSEILSRFLEEQQQIERYIEFVEEVSTIDWNRIDCINDVLGEEHIRGLRTRSDLNVEPYGDEELQNLSEDIEAVTPLVLNAIPKYRNQLQQFAQIERSEASFNYPILFEQWLDYMLDNLPNYHPLSDGQIEEHYRNGTRESFMNQLTGELDRCTDEELHAIVFETARSVPRVRVERRIERLENTLREFEQLRIMCRMSRIETETNILRQGFILLVTAFDAAVFDLVRNALERNFFSLIGHFCRDDKVSLKDFLGSFRDAADLTEQVIEKQLGMRYVKDVLMTLESLNLPLVDKAVGDNFAKLMELVQRRNIHVHNRGFVDRKYLERDKAGNIRWNLHNLQLGQLAKIDGHYLEDANRLCGKCVRAIAAWVEGGTISNSQAPPTPSNA